MLECCGLVKQKQNAGKIFMVCNGPLGLDDISRCPWLAVNQERREGTAGTEKGSGSVNDRDPGPSQGCLEESIVFPRGIFPVQLGLLCFTVLSVWLAGCGMYSTRAQALCLPPTLVFLCVLSPLASNPSLPSSFLPVYLIWFGLFFILSSFPFSAHHSCL